LLIDLSKIKECMLCPLYKNGRCLPYITNKYKKYCVIGEAPGKFEVKNGIPFCGKAGEFLWSVFDDFGLKREHFFIINSVNCRPVIGNKNGKPTAGQIRTCFRWIEHFLSILKPEKIILFGEYAMRTLLGEGNPVANNAIVTEEILFDKFKSIVVRSIHPAYCLYNKDSISLFKTSIDKFVNSKVKEKTEIKKNNIMTFFE